ncbi:MAG: VOC family protein [Vicinamibacterales bacterium]
MTEGPLLGRPLWYELLTTDKAAAERFYASVVGWSVADAEGMSPPYALLSRAGDVPVAGVMTLPEGLEAPPHWVMYVGVPGLEDGVARVESLGGHALSPVIDVPAVGRMRTMLDDQGAMFSLYEPATPPQEPEAEPTVGDVAWHELYTKDPEAAMRFYGALFGWRSTGAMDMGPMGTYHMFGRAFPLGGMMRQAPGMAGAPPLWGFYFSVSDVDAAVGRVSTGGGTVLNGPMEVPGGDRIVQCLDPQGAAFSLHQKA